MTFARKGFTAGHVRLTDYGFEFRSAAFVAQIAGTEFHQDPLVAGNKKAVATIAFTHPVDPASFESRVRLRMFSRVNDATEREIAAPAHSVVYDKLKLNAYVHSAELEVPAKAGRLEIAIQPGVTAARGGNQTDAALTTSIDVPGLNSLKIADVSLDIVRDERNEPDQVLCSGHPSPSWSATCPRVCMHVCSPCSIPIPKCSSGTGPAGRFPGASRISGPRC